MYPYHNKIKQRIKNKELIAYEYVDKYKLIVRVNANNKVCFNNEDLKAEKVASKIKFNLSRNVDLIQFILGF